MIGDVEEVSGVNESLPTEFALHANYPNPFNPTTMIKFDLPEPSIVYVSVFNVLGQEVATLINGPVEAGFKSVEWNATTNSRESLPSGIYICRLHATSLTTGTEFQNVQKMVLMK